MHWECGFGVVIQGLGDSQDTIANANQVGVKPSQPKFGKHGFSGTTNRVDGFNNGSLVCDSFARTVIKVFITKLMKGYRVFCRVVGTEKLKKLGRRKPLSLNFKHR